MSGSVYKLSCPHCQHSARVRNSMPMSPLLRVAYVQCTNVACGATFRAHMEFTHTLSPSACPNPAIDLPLADSAIRQQAVKREASRQLDIEDMISSEQAPAV